MKTMTTSLLMSIAQIALCDDLSFSLQINTNDGLCVQASINADPLIEVSVEKKILKEEGDYRYYICLLHFSRDPSADDLNRLELAILGEGNINDPMTFGTTYSKVLWKDINGSLLKVDLRRGHVTFPLGYGPGERLVYTMTSGRGYRKQNIVFTDNEGKCPLHWEATSGKSIIKLIKYEDYMRALREKQAPVWKEWRFDLLPNNHEPEFRAISPESE